MSRAFIGSLFVNILDAEVVLEPQPRVEVAGVSFVLSEDLARVFRELGETGVLVMLGPDHVQVRRGKGFTIYATEWLGREEFAFLRSPDEMLVRAVLRPEGRLGVGEEVEVYFDFKKVHFYRRSGS